MNRTISEYPEEMEAGRIFESAKWISTGNILGNWDNPVLPAPYFRKEFTLERLPGQPAVAAISGLGFYELFINGRRVGDQVLDPVFTQYDRHCPYVCFDVTSLLRPGVNAVGVVLGNGWYNCHTVGWHFDKAVWREYPKLLFALRAGSTLLLAGSRTWHFSMEGPIRFDGVRNGEQYDAAYELDGWTEPGYDDSAWRPAAVVPPPPGRLIRQAMPPCRITATYPGAVVAENAESRIFAMPLNMTGWARIRVCGPRGSEVILKYAERLNPSGDDIDMTEIARYIYSGEVQTDHYRLKGGGVEIWEPHFSYYGFQYVKAICRGGARIESLDGRYIRTDFEEITAFCSSSAELDRLWRCTCNSYCGNFTGIPTDCPHREKNGWTGDALYAAETGLTVYDSASSYAMWLRSLADGQRPSGQLPAIAPTSGWGYNGNSGPAWDSVLIQLPWYIYLYTGDAGTMARHYDAMRRYLDYLESVAEEGIVSIGLGDWSHVDRTRMIPVPFTSTGWYACDCATVAKIARVLGKMEDAAAYRRLADEIRSVFNRAFYCGDGVYAGGEMTASAMALSFHLAAPEERGAVARRLVDEARSCGHRACFGLIGAKYVPRALADNGYVEDGWQMISQPEFPGWMNWVRQGSTTLWEHWGDSGQISKNHILFGDVNAWMRQYLAGIRVREDAPGFSPLTVNPYLPSELSHLTVRARLPRETVEVAMRREGGTVRAELRRADGSVTPLRAGENNQIIFDGKTE